MGQLKHETREEWLARECVYRETHHEEILAGHRLYNATHRHEIRAKRRVYLESYSGRGRPPRTKALAFLNRFPDCTSTVDEITAIYAASVNELTGEVGEVSQAGLVLDHIHGGPAIGLIPHNLNFTLEQVEANWDALRAYLDKRKSYA